MTDTTNLTTYRIATHWLDNSLILCNNISEVDPLIFDNMRFSFFDEDDDSEVETYQYFLTDCSESDVEYLEKNFKLKFTYSNILETFILCVDHCGPSWDSVGCPVSDELVEIWGDKILYTDSSNPPLIKTNKEFVK